MKRPVKPNFRVGLCQWGSCQNLGSGWTGDEQDWVCHTHQLVWHYLQDHGQFWKNLWRGNFRLAWAGLKASVWLYTYNILGDL